MFAKKALIVAAMLAMFGCKSSETISDPPLPTPISPYTFHWKVIPTDGRVYVALPYDESLRLRVMMEDMTRYMRDANAVMCFYRKALEEPRCLQLENSAKK